MTPDPRPFPPFNGKQEPIRRVFVVLNPVAGSCAPDVVLRTLKHHFASSHDHVESVLEIHETIPGEDLPKVVRTALVNDYDLVVAAGGDGTVSAVANGLVESGTPLGIIPLGTANVLSRELGIPVDLEGACRLLSGPHTTAKIDGMRVGEYCYFTQLGVGIDAMMIRDTNREAKRRFGRAAYLWTAFTRLIGFQPRRFELHVDGTTIRQSASQVVIANCGILGQPPFRWGPDISPDDGKLDVCLVRARSLWHYLSIAGLVILGKHKKSSNVRYMTVHEHVTIATSKPHPVQADGEIIGETPVTVDVVANAITLLVPADRPEHEYPGQTAR